MNNNSYKDCSKSQKIWKKNIILRKFVSHFKLLPRESIICNGPGFKMRVRPPYTSLIGRSIYLTGVWEKEMTSFVQNRIQEGWNILDVGADVGYYSLLFASKTGKNGKVASFEPDPEPWPILNDNIKISGYSNITPYNFALSDHKGKGMMKKSGKGQLYPDKEGKEDNTSTVKMIPFDDFFKELSWKHLDLVKIDVEGAELSVLKGMEKTLKKYHPHLIIEIHTRQLKEVFNTSALEVVKFLTEKYPYKFTPIDKEEFKIPEDGNITVWADWEE